MTKPVTLILASLMMLGGWSSAAVAQVNGDNKTSPDQNGQLLVAPYDEKLMRLAEVLGSIHFLRELCKANEGQQWRDKMAALIEAEKPRPDRKARMIARFNRGYSAYKPAHRTCTKATILVIDNYMKEGVRLTSQITSRYGR